jgi:hypothetical protein
MMQRLIPDSFSMDVYCANFNHDDLGERISLIEAISDGERNRSMIHESSRIRQSSASRLQSRPSRSLGYIVPRLIWTAVAPTMMMVLSVLKLESHSSQAGIFDACFLGVVLAVLLVRWGTWIAGDRCDSFGGRATLSRTFGFTGIVIGLAGSFWFLTSLLAEQPLSS